MTVQELGGKAASLDFLSTMPKINVKPYFTIRVSTVQHIAMSGHFDEILDRKINDLPKDPLYAVRSSAVGEDSTDASWAGLFATTLHVSHDKLKEVIVDSARAYDPSSLRAYAEAHQAEAGGLALIVQEMVDAVCAGVLFTRDPRSGVHMIVEAVRGTADALVSGIAKPSRYYLNATSGFVMREEDTSKCPLSDAQLASIFEAASVIRVKTGGEVDIEWAFDRDGTLYINQSRPITGAAHQLDFATTTINRATTHIADEMHRLYGLGLRMIPDVLSDQNIAEILGENPSPMAHGLFRYLFADGDGAIKTGRNDMGYEIGTELDRGFHVIIGGRPRVSLAHDALTYRIKGMPLADYALMVNDYLAKIGGNEMLANYPEVGLYQQRPSFEYLASLFGPEKAHAYARAYAGFFGGIHALEQTLHTHVTREFLPKWRDLVESMRALSARDDLPLSEAVAQYRVMCDLLRTKACRTFVKSVRLGFFAFARARDRLIERFGKTEGEQHLNALIGYTSDQSPNFRFSKALYESAQLGSLDAVLDEFGHLSGRELEIGLPRYREEPEILTKIAAKTTSPFEGREANERAAQQREAEVAQTYGDGWEYLRHDLEMARTYLELREIVKFEYLKGYEVLRRLAMRMEAIMSWSTGLIFYLDPKEIFELPIRDTVRYMEIAQQRVREHELALLITVPAVIHASDLAAIGRPVAVGSHEVLRGIGVTNEVVEGTCVVVTDLSDTTTLSQLGPGTVIVAKQTDPAWSPVIAAVGKTGGLITEIGGVLAHASTCARELGIAAVLNVPNATTILQTGTRVRVDGRTGVVEILSAA